jgi:hypothetical protein
MSVLAQYEVTAAFPSTVGGAGTTIKYFSSNPPASLWNVGQPGINAPATTNNLGAVPTATNALGQLTLPSAGKMNGQRFEIFASGYVSAAAGLVTYTLQSNTNVNLTGASPAYVILGPGGVAPTNTPGTASNLPFHLHVVLEGDSASGIVQGIADSMLNNVFADDAAITALSGVNFSGSSAGFGPLGFVIGVTFATSAAGNSASLTEFKIVQF